MRSPSPGEGFNRSRSRPIAAAGEESSFPMARKGKSGSPASSFQQTSSSAGCNAPVLSRWVKRLTSQTRAVVSQLQEIKVLHFGEEATLCIHVTDKRRYVGNAARRMLSELNLTAMPD